MKKLPQAYESTFELPNKGEGYEHHVGIVDRYTGEIVELGVERIEYAVRARTAGDDASDEWHRCTIVADRTTVIDNFSGVLLLGRRYHMTRVTNPDGTGWVRFTNMARMKA